MNDKEYLKTSSAGRETTDALKSWMMVALTGAFVSLYTAALLGWLKPLNDVTVVARLEPIIFVIIGYYFGRLPAQQTERALKEEITRQTREADAARHVKEQVEQECGMLEERLKNAKISLIARADDESDELTANSFSAADETVARLRHAVSTALNILNS